jgi:predicted nucleic acid-binding protein
MTWRLKGSGRMVCPSCLTDPSALLVVDTSVAINLNATRIPEEILNALPNRVLVTEDVYFELGNGTPARANNADTISALVEANHVEFGRLSEVGKRHFESLVIGRASETLDDGEAATIAYAIEHEATALIDERKANRICTERFPQLRTGCTVDLLAHPSVRGTLGIERLSLAVFNALYDGRMRVLPQHTEWVVNLIGQDRAMRCHSLSTSVRRALAR